MGKYYWAGHTELVSFETGSLLARLFPSWLVVDVHEHKLGKSVIRGEGKENMDVVFAMALIVRERSEEGRQAVFPLIASRDADFLDGDGQTASYGNWNWVLRYTLLNS